MNNSLFKFEKIILNKSFPKLLSVSFLTDRYNGVAKDFEVEASPIPALQFESFSYPSEAKRDLAFFKSLSNKSMRREAR